MLRFILNRETFYEVNQMHGGGHFTVDIDVPELESLLRSGGSGESGFDMTDLVAVEVLAPKLRLSRSARKIKSGRRYPASA